jgi:hypothetical protein
LWLSGLYLPYSQGIDGGEMAYGFRLLLYVLQLFQGKLPRLTGEVNIDFARGARGHGDFDVTLGFKMKPAIMIR